MENEDKTVYAIAGIGAVIVAVAGLRHMHVVRTERKKREKLVEWEKNSLDAIRASRERLERIAEDPTVSSTELFEAWVEESKFIDVITSQPMY